MNGPEMCYVKFLKMGEFNDDPFINPGSDGPPTEEQV
jgi:hypothetical protein